MSVIDPRTCTSEELAAWIREEKIGAYEMALGLARGDYSKDACGYRTSANGKEAAGESILRRAQDIEKKILAWERAHPG